MVFIEKGIPGGVSYISNSKEKRTTSKCKITVRKPPQDVSCFPNETACMVGQEVNTYQQEASDGFQKQEINKTDLSKHKQDS